VVVAPVSVAVADTEEAEAVIGEVREDITVAVAHGRRELEEDDLTAVEARGPELEEGIMVAVAHGQELDGRELEEEKEGITAVEARGLGLDDRGLEEEEGIMAEVFIFISFFKYY
jgi:hypothetical protein